MKLVPFFVPGDVDAAVAVINKLNLTYEFAQMMPATMTAIPFIPGDNPFDPKYRPLTQGYNVFVRVTDQRVIWLNNHLKELGL